MYFCFQNFEFLYFFRSEAIYYHLRARLVGLKICNRNGNGNGIECKRVKMKIRDKLGNDRKVKFVGLEKV